MYAQLFSAFIASRCFAKASYAGSLLYAQQCACTITSKCRKIGCMRNLCRVCVAGLVLASCSPSGFGNQYASGRYTSSIMQCSPYAREVSGVQLRGDAGDWWYAAQGRYQRGNVPARGAVLVLRKTNRLRYGHVAVVKQVLNPRLINVTHSNWGSDGRSRRIIYDSMHAEDVSSANNWTSVRFWNYKNGTFGFPYAAHGFIYP